MKKTLATTWTLVGFALSVSQPAVADCASRIEELRALQAKTPYLDAQRPDLEKLRQVAQNMGDQGREELCLDLVEELEALVDEHRDHTASLDELEKYASPVHVASYSRELDSSQLVGMSVRNRLGEELGVVSGIVIAPSQGRAEAIKVEHGGFLGVGEKTVRVPWKEVQLTRDASAVVVDLTADELEDLPQAE